MDPESWIDGTTVVVPSDAIEIPESAFKDNDNITRVMFQPNSTCQRIGNSAFHGCDSLQTIYIPDSVTIIGERVFADCESIRTVHIPGPVTAIGDWAFYYCTSLQTVNIPDSVTAIGRGTFSSCETLKTVRIPNFMTTIELGTFRGCKSLQTVIIPDSVTAIEHYAFAGCTSLETVHIPDSVMTIEEEVFAGCTSLKTMDIPLSVTEIGRTAFVGCKSLKYVTIPVGSEVEIVSDGHRMLTKVDDSELEVVIPGGKVYYLNNWAKCENLYELLVSQNKELEGFRGTFQLKTRKDGTLVDPVKNRIDLRRIIRNRGLTLHPQKREAEAIILPQSKRSKTQTTILPY